METTTQRSPAASASASAASSPSSPVAARRRSFITTQQQHHAITLPALLAANKGFPLFVVVGIWLVMMSISPMILVERTNVHQYIMMEQDGPLQLTGGDNDNIMSRFVFSGGIGNYNFKNNNNNNNLKKSNKDIEYRQTPDGRMVADLQLSDLQPDDATWTNRPVARGVAGRPLDQTPSVKTARRAPVECDFNVDSVAYWNVDDHDHEFQPQPFVVGSTTAVVAEEKFLTFTPHRGAWDDIRLSLENILVIAAVTKRTLVLPPREFMYAPHLDQADIYRGLEDFLPLRSSALSRHIKVITMAEYLQHPLAPAVPPDLVQDQIQQSAEHCTRYFPAADDCIHVYDYLRKTAGAVIKLIATDAAATCLVFDEEAYHNSGRPPTNGQTLGFVAEHCGPTRTVMYWNEAECNEPAVLLIDTDLPESMLFNHFYSTIHFTSPRLSHYYKRLVRDYFHYNDAINCAAGKIVKALQAEAALLQLNSNNNNSSQAAAAWIPPDDQGAGGYSALHVQRGEFQYADVKLTAQQWYENTKDIWLPNELLYIATNEEDKSFFADLAQYYPVRFLEDYTQLAGLSNLDPNFKGMIDTVVASRARAFCGTYYSTQSGYINRLRGYHGLSMQNSWYALLSKQRIMHAWYGLFNRHWEFEYPDGWIGIDADEWPSKDNF